jgi:hypothetical protein
LPPAHSVKSILDSVGFCENFVDEMPHLDSGFQEKLRVYV